MDIQKYTRVMQTIKGRKEHIDWITDQAESLGNVSTFMSGSPRSEARVVPGSMHNEGIEALNRDSRRISVCPICLECG